MKDIKASSQVIFDVPSLSFPGGGGILIEADMLRVGYPRRWRDSSSKFAVTIEDQA